MNYTSLEQRIAHAYMDMFPPFVPLKDGKVSTQSQEHFYLFMKNVYQSIFDTPEFFFNKIFTDDAFPNRFNKSSYGKPDLDAHMKRDIKIIDELLTQLFFLGANSTVDHGRLILSETVEIKKKVQSVLLQLGLQLDHHVLSCDQFDDLFPAWNWMSARENATVLSFSRCMYDPDYPYMQDIYSTLFGSEKAFERLIEYLQKCGYTRFDLKRGPFTLDYAKKNVEKEVPLGSPLHADPYHYGITADYKYEAANPQFLVLRIVDMKNILLKFNLMSDPLKEFTLKYAKKCDLCEYCTQTDKSGKRIPLAVDVFYHGNYSICPLYPGYNFWFTALDEVLATNLIRFLDFMDNHFSGAMVRSF